MGGSAKVRGQYSPKKVYKREANGSMKDTKRTKGDWKAKEGVEGRGGGPGEAGKKTF